MIQILYTVKFLFPFLLLALFFCLYRKDYGFMKRFYYKLVMSFNARKFYCIVLLTVLIFLNWCSFETDHNYAVACAALMTIPFMSNKVADRILHRLHESLRLLVTTLILAMVCYTAPYLNSIFQVLFTVSVASLFYPSERVLGMKSLPEFMTNYVARLNIAIKFYY